MTDNEAIIANYDPDSDEFKRIAAKSLEKESHCMYGPSFLVFERSRGLFLEFFCGNKSSRSEAKKVYSYLPLTQADIDAKAATGNDVSNLQPHGPLPLTLKSRLVEKGTYSWHVPVVTKCSTAFTNFPKQDRVNKEIGAFLNVKDNGVERDGRRGRSRPLSVICSPPDLPRTGLAPAGFLEHTRRTAPAR